MTSLTDDTVRRLDALNLIEALARDDAEARRQISAVYARASIVDNGLSSWELAHCCAHFASLLLNLSANGDQLLTMCRARVLAGDAQP
jgi:hypothetical protein